MNLPRLRSDAEYDRAVELARMSGVPLSRCPTCGSNPEKVRVAYADGTAEAEGREYGTYKYMGEVYECDCETQIQLRKHYLLAGIGEQYMRLDWADYRNDAVKRDVELYLGKWDAIRRNGMGIEFGGEALGVGKTFAATYVAKELIKKGVQVLFVPFLEFLSTVIRDDDESRERMERMRRVTVLVVDELRPPRTERQAWFGDRFEELVRHRTNFNLPIITTTNLTEDELRTHYPRVYSLMSAKHIRLDLTGQDARMSWIAAQNLDLVLNDEVRPIT
ncbi:ATP-binding protein [Candidatus Solirubrobacter pratensis]|uniref:ATP-binding protein n=1 Tax=Candidatus Solirubrobacter pratensis TaxID=1298857 RepID=UPI0004880C4D|nr:ATP-binding protein [Candidatus Solirubrobacter pratensis]